MGVKPPHLLNFSPYFKVWQGFGSIWQSFFHTFCHEKATCHLLWQIVKIFFSLLFFGWNVTIAKDFQIEVILITKFYLADKTFYGSTLFFFELIIMLAQTLIFRYFFQKIFFFTSFLRFNLIFSISKPKKWDKKRELSKIFGVFPKMTNFQKRGKCS